MTPELITKLKEAKFPFTYEGLRGEWGGTMHPPEDYVPTLSELRKACGSKLAVLNQCYEYGESVGWDAISTSGTSGGTYKTPEEAVACLYLSLHHHD